MAFKNKEKKMQRDWKHIVHNELRTNERSIAWLSRRLGYSPSHVNRLLSGERPLPEDKKTLLAQILNISKETLFG